MKGQGSPSVTTFPKLISVRLAARMLGVSVRTIYRYVDEGRLRATRLGPRTLRVYADSVSELIETGSSHPSE